MPNRVENPSTWPTTLEFEVNEIVVGEPRTIVPASAKATVSIRLAPGQRSAAIAAELERLLRGAAPPGADVEIATMTAEPSLFPVDSRPMQLAADALRTATRLEPVFQRSGGSIPIVGDFKRVLGMDTIMVGFALDDDRVHSPNEKFDLTSFHKGMRSWARILAAMAE